MNDCTTTRTNRSTTSQSNHTGKEHIELLTRIWSSNEALLLRNSVICHRGSGCRLGAMDSPHSSSSHYDCQDSGLSSPTNFGAPSKQEGQHNLENTLQMKHLDPVTDLYKSSVPLTCPENWIESPGAGEHNTTRLIWASWRNGRAEEEQREEIREGSRNHSSTETVRHEGNRAYDYSDSPSWKHLSCSLKMHTKACTIEPVAQCNKMFQPTCTKLSTYHITDQMDWKLSAGTRRNTWLWICFSE